MSKPKISILTLTFNEQDVISNFIDSVIKSNFKKEDLELIVVDNNSSDGTCNLIMDKYPNVKLVKRSENIGSAGINDGIKYAHGEYVFVLDPDIILEKNCLKNLYTESKKKDLEFCAPITIDVSDNVVTNKVLLSRSFNTLPVSESKFYNSKEPFFDSMSGIFFIKNCFLKKMKYIYDKDYFLYSEDLDFCIRVTLSGRYLMRIPSAKVINPPSGSTTLRFHTKHKLLFLQERNKFITFFKTYSLIRIFIYTPYSFIFLIAAFIRDVISGRFKCAFSRILAFFWVFLHLRLIYSKRAKFQKERTNPDTFLFKYSNELEFIRVLFSK